MVLTPGCTLELREEISFFKPSPIQTNEMKIQPWYLLGLFGCFHCGGKPTFIKELYIMLDAENCIHVNLHTL